MSFFENARPKMAHRYCMLPFTDGTFGTVKSMAWFVCRKADQ